MLFCEMIYRICSFAIAIRILLFDKDCYIWIFTKKEPFSTKDINYFTLPQSLWLKDFCIPNVPKSSSIIWF